MSKFTKALMNILRRGGLAFTCFPAAMAFAAALAGLGIWMVYDEPITGMKLWSALLLTCAASSLVGAALSVLSRKTSGSKGNFAWSNLLTLVFAGASFAGLYLLGSNPEEPSIRIVSAVLAAGAIALIAFVVIPTYRSNVLDYNKTFFMTLKSFFIAALYTGVLTGGLAFVALAVQKLLWADMDEKVYAYISILSALVGYAFFLGYFPDFRREEDAAFTERAETAAKQPKFAEVLFQNIMIPILGILSVVLLIWSVKIAITRDWPAYSQIVGIFTAYSLFSILLYILVSSYDTRIVRWYRRGVPIATLVFLAFEAYPIYTRLSESGLQPAVYAVLCVWVFAVIVSACFIVVPIVKNRIAAYVAAALILLFVLPFAGAMDASYYTQSYRLRSALIRNGMLSGDDIAQSSAVSTEDKAIITEAVQYLFRDNDKPAPAWLSANLANPVDFYKVFGFNEYYRSEPDNNNPSINEDYISVRSGSGVLDIQGYMAYIPRDLFYKIGDVPVTAGGSDYTVSILDGQGTLGCPVIKVVKGQEILIETDLKGYADTVYAAYGGSAFSSGKGGYVEVAPGDLAFETTGGGVTVKVFVNAVDFNLSNGEIKSVNIDIAGIYFR